MAASRGIKPVTAYGFNGMNNLPNEPANLLDDKKRITPAYILNAEVTDGRVIKPRGGYVLSQSLVGLHSLAGEEKGLSIMLGVASGVLYRLEGEKAYSLGTVTGPRSQVSYAEVNNQIFMGNLYWQGVLDLITMEVAPWGVPLPAAPAISLTSGDIPPGRYSICYTQVQNGRISGNGPVVSVSWSGQTQGIQLNNLPTGGQCWITQPDGEEFFLAQVVSGQIVGLPQLTPLPSFAVGPPPGFVHFCQAHGRIWGVAGKKLFYSEPAQYDWFKTGTYLPFLEDLAMVMPVNDGIYVGSLASCWFLQGTEPAKMILKRVGDGVIPGSLTLAQISAGIAGGAATSQIFAAQSKLPTPVWMSPSGWVVGTQGGNLTHMTEGRLRINPRAQGASLYRMKDGIPQVITSLHGPPVRGDDDPDLAAIFTRGRILTPAPYEIILTDGCIAVGG